MVKLLNESINDSVCYVAFRKERNNYTNEWSPIAFWTSADQSCSYGRVNICACETDGHYYWDECPYDYLYKTKPLDQNDPEFSDFINYVMRELSFSTSEYGDGFDKVLVRKKLPQDVMRASWNRLYREEQEDID